MPSISGTTGHDHLIGTDANDLIEGLAGADTLEGGLGNDTLMGGAGNDSMIGGAGNDIYYVQQAGDAVVESLAGAAGGVDTVYSYLADYTLGANVENIRIMSAGAANATGNGLANVFYAGAGDNAFDGAGGNDTVSYQYATSAVRVWLSTAGTQNTQGSGFDALTSIENLTGSKFNDTLGGSAGNNILNGGAGTDTVDYQGSAAGVSVNLSVTVQQDTVGAGKDTLKGFENVFGSMHNDRLQGSAGNNELYGLAGNDTLLGGYGDDTLDGGIGIDTVSYQGVVSPVSVYLFSLDQDTGGAGIDRLQSIENAIGGADGDDLRGNNGDNLLDGGQGTGNDTLIGGGGNDTLIGGDGFDTASYAFAGGAVTVSLATNAAQATGGEGSDVLVEIEALTGSLYDDALTGNAGNNTLDGAAGADTLTGGAGDDLYRVGSSTDVVIEDADGGYDRIISTASSYTMGANVEDFRFDTDGFANVTGNASGNIIWAGAGSNVIDGGAGIDMLSYEFAAGPVSISLAQAGGQITGNSGTDAVSNIEWLKGSDYGDSLGGDAQMNLLDGNGGGDTLIGGGADDTYYVRDGYESIVETSGAGSGIDTVISYIDTYTLHANVENAWVGTGLVSGKNLVGNALDNVLRANGYDNTLNGGSGSDTASWEGASAAVQVSLAVAGAQATGGSGSDTLVSIENLRGSSHGDTLTGNGGDNVLDGGAGADTLTGGDGNDTYVVDNAGDVVVEAAFGGAVDTVKLNGNFAWTLGDNIEAAQLLGGGLDVTGNAQDNSFYMGPGNETVDGGAGSDTVYYTAATSAVTVNLGTGVASGGGLGTDSLSGVERVFGSNYNDTLTGSAGSDWLMGGAGADSMTGGAGNDFYYVDNVGDAVVEASNAGTDTVIAYTSLTIGANVENAAIWGNGAINVTGNTANNLVEAGNGNNVMNGGDGVDTVSYVYATDKVTVSLASASAQATGGSGTDTLSNFENLTGSDYDDSLTGSTANNVIDGAMGDDTMAGGAGNDTYYADSSSDVVTEASGAGIDTVIASADYTLGNYVEYLRMAGGSIDGTGNSMDNVIYSGSGDNVLNGMGGINTLSYYYAGAAVNVNMGAAGAQATGGSGTDTISNFTHLNGSLYNDTLAGDQYANGINGGSGNDRILGKGGMDALTGSYGNDTFVFDTALSALSNVDSITDFASGFDRIEIDNAVFTAFSARGAAVTAENLVYGTSALESDDYLVYDSSTGKLYYDADGSGAGAKVQFATLDGHPSLAYTDFVIG